MGRDLRTAVDAAYEAVGKIAFDGAFHRADIAHRAFER
jgi:phosphoribosylamine-glycine ligase